MKENPMLSNVQRNDPYLLTSELEEYLTCGLHYRFSHVDKLLPEITSDQEVFDEAFKRTLHSFYQARRDNEDMSDEDVQIYFERMWREATDRYAVVKFRDGWNYSSLLKRGKEVVTAYVKQVPDAHLKVVDTDYPFTLELKELPAPVIGTIDLIEENKDGALILTEFMTVERHYSLDEMSRHIQLGLLCLCSRLKEFRYREIILRVDCMTTEAKPQLEQVLAFVTPDDDTRALNLVNDTWVGISLGFYVSNIASPECATCGYRSACDAYLLGNSD